MRIRQTLNSVCLLQKGKRGKRGKRKWRCNEFQFERVLARERVLLFRYTCDPTVDMLRDKKENCSTRKGLRVGTEFREFLQTP